MSHRRGIFGVRPATAGEAASDIVKTKLDSGKATTSGTEFDFDKLFSTITGAVVTFSGISLSITDEIMVQLGTSNGIGNSNYLGAVEDTSAAVNLTSSFLMNRTGVAAGLYNGMLHLELHDADDNVWAALGGLGRSDSTTTANSTVRGTKGLDGPLTTIRVTRNGTDTFDAGAINVKWVGV